MKFLKRNLPLRLALWCLATLLLTQCGPYKTETVVEGYKGKALANPFLAMERFLEGCRLPIKPLSDMAFLQNRFAVILVPEDVELVRQQHLIDQVRRYGGHAIFLLHGTELHTNDHNSKGKTSSPYLDTEAFRKNTAPLLNGLKISYRLPNSASADKTVAGLGSTNEDYTVAWDNAPVLDANALPGHKLEWVANTSPAGTHALTMEHGNGKVTLLASATPFRNVHFAENDHAAFLHDLLVTAHAEPGYLFWYQPSPTTLLALLAEFYGRALLGLVLIVLFWLWHRLPRFGPIFQPNPVLAQPSISGHLSQVGRFLWQRGHSNALLESFRRAIDSRWRVQERPEHEMLPFLAEKAGVSLAEAEKAWLLQAVSRREGDDFVESIAVLQKMLHAAC